MEGDIFPGWNLKSGELNRIFVSEDEYWSLFNVVYSDACLKHNTYKYGLIKSIVDNLFNSYRKGIEIL